ncbi:Vegetative incompatibility HET-E-1-like protein [Cladobotryum mycophilum]|uniref:Vegetative incompatibility HET-E-1-like protein n=1 Tax=Cladobotryum mycophilum TaxID=491253 RepID=A0ABR0SUV5_9HYPO
MASILTFLQEFWVTTTPQTNAKNRPSGYECWRIENIPAGWTEEDLATRLRTINGLEAIQSGSLSIFPSFIGDTQTAILKTEAPPAYLQHLDRSQSHPITVYHSSEFERNTPVYLSIDCHFHGLTPLNSPTGDNIIDVIAVTGLSGHAFGSWRNRKSHTMWLMDFLPRDMKENVRILTYGYDSNLRERGKKTMLEFRRKFLQNLMIARQQGTQISHPIVFVGHSLGCLVITQALLQSESDPEYRNVLNATRAVLFFGAPHAGMNVDALVEMVETITSGDRQSTRLKLLDQLRDDSDFLDDQKERLIQVWKNPRLKLVSFYELQTTPVVTQDSAGNWERRGDAVKLVNSISSNLFLPNESRYSVDGNHSDIVKFMNSADITYQTVLKHLRGYLADHTITLQNKALNDNKDRSKELQDFLDTIPAFSCQGYRDGAYQKRHGNTCQWVFQCEGYLHWIEHESANVLWLSGDPGSGKSVSLAYFTMHVKEKYQARDGQFLVVAYFFCDSKIEEQNTATAIVKGLLHQILYQIPTLYNQISHDYLLNLKSTWGFENLWQVFRDVVSKNSEAEIFCVVDALDECEKDSRFRLLELLSSLLKTASNFKMLVSSRPHIRIAATLPGVEEVHIAAQNDKDIRQFVSDQVHQLAQMKGLPENLEKETKLFLMKRSKGMFLWASLILSGLKNSSETNAASIRAQLERLPEDISGIYAKILAEINPSSRPKAKKVIQWVLFAKRPLSTNELKIALALHPDHTQISLLQDRLENNVCYFLNTLFGPIMKVEDDRVGLVHESAKDFLTDQVLMQSYDSQESYVSVFYSSPAESNLSLAIDCLNYLSSEEFAIRPSLDILKYYSRLSDYPFLQYAAIHWPEHLRGADGSYSESLLNSFFRLVQSDVKMSSAYQILYEQERRFYSFTRNSPFKSTPPLQIFASLGFPKLVRLLLDKGADVNARGGVRKRCDGSNPQPKCRGGGRDTFIAISGYRHHRIDAVPADSNLAWRPRRSRPDVETRRPRNRRNADGIYPA